MAAARLSFAVTYHVNRESLMSPSQTASGRNRRLLSSVAVVALLWPTNGWTQIAAISRGLDPIVVEGQTARAAKPRAATRSSASAARAQRAATSPAATNPAATLSPTASAAPTFNLGAPASSASRLNLTPLQTPASVEIIKSETIAERGQRNVIDAVTQNATGFTASPQPGNGGLSFTTRGFAGNGTVMSLYDGTRMYVGAGTMTFPFDTWTAQRIEVLRGPASVMYGEGAIGGAINVISKKPLAVQRNEAEISLDTNLTRRLAVDSGGPINPNVTYRLAAIGNMSDGWVDRDNTSNVAVSGSVRVQAADNLAFTLSEDYADRSPSRYFGTPLVGGRLDESLRFQNYNVGDAGIRYRDNWTQLKTEWDVSDSVSVKNVSYYLSSHRHWKNVESYAFSPTTGNINRNSYIEIFHDQEQIGSRTDATFRGHLFGLANQFVAGFDVNRIAFTSTNNSPYAGASSVSRFNFDPGAFLPVSPTRPGFHTLTTQYGVFAENRLSLTDQLAVVTGIRSDQPTVERTDFLTPSASFEKSYSAPSWRAGLVYNPIPDFAIYGQYSTAVDPVTNLITMTGVNRDFALSTGKQIEVGVKQSLAGGRAEWTLAGYQIVKNNLLARDPLNPANTNPLQIGQQSSRGIEASAGLIVVDGLRLDANVAWLRAQYDDFTQVVGGRAVNYAGNVPANVPQLVSNIWATWAFAPNWSANAGVQLVGQTFADNANTLTRPAYGLVNAGLSWKPDARQTLSLRIYNLFDTVYTTSGNTTQWMLGMPRTAELSYNVKF
ncbi:TonB-dependent siderophore receptor [Rhodopseudomonas palustris BisB5]|uniref:TonB-dependent siderophore receptor n=1 Tax=Rhodopseudomonas palustris (strain BisB5) TaxID=316057 RepID=Q13DA1_RHOPS|nr:TonB-dependent siderophore receptor [Rhodopseudomonas palustris BisB5]